MGFRYRGMLLNILYFCPFRQARMDLTSSRYRYKCFWVMASWTSWRLERVAFLHRWFFCYPPWCLNLIICCRHCKRLGGKCPLSTGNLYQGPAMKGGLGASILVTAAASRRFGVTGRAGYAQALLNDFVNLVAERGRLRQRLNVACD